MLAELEKQINLSVDMAETEKGTSSSVNPKKKDSLLGTPISVRVEPYELSA